MASSRAVLLDGASVLVPAALAQAALDVLSDGVRWRAERGREVSDEVRRLAGELARAAELARNLVPIGSDRGSGRFRSVMVNPVTTRQYAEALGISERAARKRAASGKVPAVMGDDGRWLMELGDVELGEAAP